MAEGITPLEVMLSVMRERWEGGDKDGAVLVAKDAAPYIHPKLANVDAKHSGPDGGSIVFTWEPSPEK
jgi:hypothetical protein